MNQQQCLPKYWTLPMLTNFTRHTLDSQSTEYKFVADKFHQSWTNYRNPFPNPAPAPPSHSMPVRPLPPAPSAHIPSTNNHPPSSFPSGVLQRFAPIPLPVSNNNGAPINQPPPPSSHGFGNMPYSMLSGTNPSVQPPPPIPPLPGPFLPQQIYRSPALYSPASVSNQFLNHPLVRARRSRSVNHGNQIPKIIQIERIQNQRWFKQYSAHDCEFRQKLGKQTEQWLFHG